MGLKNWNVFSATSVLVRHCSKYFQIQTHVSWKYLLCSGDTFVLTLPNQVVKVVGFRRVSLLLWITVKLNSGSERSFDHLLSPLSKYPSFPHAPLLLPPSISCRKLTCRTVTAKWPASCRTPSVATVAPPCSSAAPPPATTKRRPSQLWCSDNGTDLKSTHFWNKSENIL